MRTIEDIRQQLKDEGYEQMREVREIEAEIHDIDHVMAGILSQMTEPDYQPDWTVICALRDERWLHMARRCDLTRDFGWNVSHEEPEERPPVEMNVDAINDALAARPEAGLEYTDFNVDRPTALRMCREMVDQVIVAAELRGEEPPPFHLNGHVLDPRWTRNALDYLIRTEDRKDRPEGDFVPTPERSASQVIAEGPREPLGEPAGREARESKA